MSHLIARLLLSMLVFPLGALVYLVSLVFYLNLSRSYGNEAFNFAGVVCWTCVGSYWVLLWRGSVRWTAFRVFATVAAVVLAGVAGLMVTVLWEQMGPSFRTRFVGPAWAIVLWLVSTVFIWRESVAERAARLGASGRDGIVCPTCGYNLTGLKEPRCPECGTQFTLDELLASQPSRAAAELTD
jgi:hypothetical protein